MNTQRGFTLIEIIVSLGIFSMVALVAVGAFLKVIDANKKSQSLKTAVNNLNFALEAMSREMRVGSQYQCVVSSGSGLIYPSNSGDNVVSPINCPLSDPGNTLVFSSSENKLRSNGSSCNLVYAYRFNKVGGATYGTLEKAVQTECGDSLSGTDFIPIVSSDLRVSDFEFVVSSVSPPGARIQPRIIMKVSAYAGVKEKERTYFNLQTSVSQRIINQSI